MPLFGSKARDLISFSIYQARQENSAERIKARRMMLDFYQGDQYYLDEYQRKYGFELGDLPPISTGLTKRVVNRISMVYKRPPQRSLVNENGDPIENDGLQQFIQDNPKFNMQVKKYERHHNLLGNVLFRFAFSESRQKLLFYIESDFIPEFDESNKLYPIGYHIPMPMDIDSKDKIENKWLFISDDEMYYHDDHGEKWPIDPSFPDDMSNPYKTMPLIDLTDEDIDSYWVNGLRNLVDFHRLYNIAILNMFYAQHKQAHDLIWLKDIISDLLPKDPKTGEPVLKTGSGFALNLGPDGAAGVLGFNPKLVESLDMLRGLANMELSTWGITIVWREGGNPMSGYAIKLDNIELLEKRESDIDTWVLFEKQAYQILQVMNDYHRLGYNMPDAEVKTDFVEPEFPLEPAEERSQAEWEWKNNLSSREDWLIDRNPDLDEEAAAKRIEENAVKNRQLRGLFNQQGAAPIPGIGGNGGFGREQ